MVAYIKIQKPFGSKNNKDTLITCTASCFTNINQAEKYSKKRTRIIYGYDLAVAKLNLRRCSNDTPKKARGYHLIERS
jgi:hypothetical protein